MHACEIIIFQYVSMISKIYGVWYVERYMSIYTHDHEILIILYVGHVWNWMASGLASPNTTGSNVIIHKNKSMYGKVLCRSLFKMALLSNPYILSIQFSLLIYIYIYIYILFDAFAVMTFRRSVLTSTMQQWTSGK